MDINIDEERIKELCKEAIAEFIEERKGMLCELFAEVIEDIALANAIEEGESRELVSRRDKRVGINIYNMITPTQPPPSRGRGLCGDRIFYHSLWSVA